MKKESSSQMIISLSIIVLIVLIISLILMLSFKSLSGVNSFKNSCQSFGGSFYEIVNVSCSVGAPNCMFICSLNSETFSMSELGDLGLSRVQDFSFKLKNLSKTGLGRR